jgi:hypothetical protein
MSNYPPDEPVYPATPIYEETIVTTTGQTSGTSGSDSKASRATDQAKRTAGQAKDTVQQTAADVKEEAAGVASTAKDAGGQVASTTVEEAQRVAADTVDQARELFGQATTELSSQASKQQERLTQTIRTFGQDLSKMGSGQKVESGPAAELMQNLAGRAQSVADWFESRSPEEVLYDVRQFAARRPGLFIGLAAVAGVVASRVTKALVADAKPGLTGSSQGSSYLGSDATYVTEVQERTYVVPEPAYGEYGTQDTTDVEYGTGLAPENEFGTGREYGTGTVGGTR